MSALLRSTFRSRAPACAVAVVATLVAAAAHATVAGLTGTSFDLVAREGTVSVADGGSLYAWGYAEAGGLMQYPGVTMIVSQGQTITVTLRNELPAWAGNVSIDFPGHVVQATGGVAGAITQEAPPDGVTQVAYTFVADQAGTYLYQSATRPDLQVEMGLIGAIIVRPLAGAGFAYNDAATAFDREYLFLLSEMDPSIHQAVESAQSADVDTTGFFPTYWFINGRAAPDTMAQSFVGWLPHQPYNCMPRMHPGERLLMRVVGAGRDMHPLHHHGNHARIIAKDGRLLSSAPGAGPDLSHKVFTIQSVPGETVDAIFEWTGKGLGWDIYGDPAANGHTCIDGDGDGFDDTTREYCGDHGKPFPVVLPEALNLAFGGFWSGSPFLGAAGLLPPGEGGLNPDAGYAYMWHSHTEKEMVNNNIFPGGMMTMLIIEAPGVPIN